MNLKVLLILLIFVVLGVIIYYAQFDQHRSREYESSPTIEANKNLPILRNKTQQVILNETTSQHTITQTEVTPNTGQQNTTESDIHFYIFGISTCPHCQNLKSKIIKFFGSKSLTFYDLATEEGFKKYGDAFKILINYTFSPGVPQVGIFENGNLRAIILGDFGSDNDFKDRVNYYITVVDNLIQEYHQLHILIQSKDGVYYVNDTKEIQTLTNVFLHPEKFSQNP